MLPLLKISTPEGSESVWPSARMAGLPLMTSRDGAAHNATRVLPIFVATALLTAALGQVGAPDTCRACTVKPLVWASRKSPEAWKSYSNPLKVRRWVSPTVVAAEQFEDAPPPELSSNSTAGPGCDANGVA